MVEETNELKERLETTLITRTFNISGMPLKAWEEVDAFCKANYGDVRWVMLSDLVRLADFDFKYELLWSELEAIKEKVANLEEKKGIDVNQKPTVKTFGDMKERNVTGDRFGRQV